MMRYNQKIVFFNKKLEKGIEKTVGLLQNPTFFAMILNQEKRNADAETLFGPAAAPDRVYRQAPQGRILQNRSLYSTYLTAVR